MKFLHISDLHLGKRLSEFSLLEDQEHILDKIVKLAKEHEPKAVFIAGDIYDKSTPTVEAIQLLDSFLVRLNALGISVFIISGNHDNAERVAFGAALFKNSNVHIVQSYNGTMTPITIADEHGDINIWMMPYLKPSIVRKHFEDRDIVSYSDAVAAALSVAPLDKNVRNVLIAHQFITGAATCESEELIIGGSENIDVSFFDDFDYVALGHLHKPQNVGRKTVRYCGSPLKYSFSEIDHKKSVTLVTIGNKGDVDYIELPLAPLRDMREIRGLYCELMDRENYKNTNTNDYVRIILTDEQDEPDAMSKLRMVYPNLMGLDYDNLRTRARASLEIADITENKSPIEIFSEFFERQNGQPMSGEQSEYAADLFDKILREAE